MQSLKHNLFVKKNIDAFLFGFIFRENEWLRLQLFVYLMEIISTKTEKLFVQAI